MKKSTKSVKPSSGSESFVAKRRATESLGRWRGDFFGGTVAALIAVPYGMALAIAMGLRPEAGLYTSIIGGAISGMISDAPVVVSGLSATVVPVLAVLVRTHGVGAALAAGALSGLIMTLIGALRIGRFFSYLPQSVIAAFTSGLGVIIISSQIKVVFGVKPDPAEFDLGVIDDFWAVFKAYGQSDYQTLSIASLVIALMFLLPRWKKSIPASLVAVIIASFVVHVCGWKLTLLGALPDSFPRPSLAAVDFTAFSALLHPAFTLAGLITINQLLTVVVTDRLSEAGSEVKFNRELIAQGAANMVCPFFGAPPGVAMLARTVASARAGAVSRWSALAHSLILLLFLLTLSGFVSRIPLASLGAVTVAVGLQLIDWKRFRDLPRLKGFDAALFLLTFCLVIFSDLIVGVGVGSLIAMLLFVERAAQSTRLELVVPDPAKMEPSAIISFHGPSYGDTYCLSYNLNEPQTETQMYRLSGPLFFASSEKVLTKLTREVTARTLVLDMTKAGPIDSAATDCLRQIAERQRLRGGELRLIGLDQPLLSSITNQVFGASPGSAGVPACQAGSKGRSGSKQARTPALPGKALN